MSGSFYSNSTFVAIVILAIVLLLIAALMVYVLRHITSILKDKSGAEVEPGFFERNIKPKMDSWNPTIVTLLVIGGVGCSLALVMVRLIGLPKLVFSKGIRQINLLIFRIQSMPEPWVLTVSTATQLPVRVNTPVFHQRIRV